MTGIERKRFDAPDETVEVPRGRMAVVRVGDEEVWRSVFQPGWNWIEDFRELAEGLSSCPMTHREYVISGRIRYLSDDGAETIGEAGDFLFIRPGHLAWTLGDEPVTLLDWDNEE